MQVMLCSMSIIMQVMLILYTTVALFHRMIFSRIARKIPFCENMIMNVYVSVCCYDVIHYSVIFEAIS